MESRSLAPALYVSHFMSMWNARGFEFGAILFLATIYPGTLLPMSLYALFRATAAVALSPTIGHLIDSRNRLSVIRISILGQRLAVAASCAVFALLFQQKDRIPSMAITLLLGLLVLLGCLEKLCSIMNTVAVERDWVVVIAMDDDEMLQVLNAQMRRIDLFCKLVAPLAIALLHGWSATVAVWATFGTNAMSVGVEYLLIARVFHQVPALAERRLSSELERSDGREAPRLQSYPQTTFYSRYVAPASNALAIYVRQTAFLPSLALSALYLTVLSFSGQMMTFLLAIPEPRITSTTVGLLRTVSTAAEIASTFAAPRLMAKIGPVRAGIWFLSWQTLCLSCAVGLLWTGGFSSSPTIIPIFILGVILSRTGLWSFDLCAQLIIQESIQPPHRGSFSAVEMSLQNLFELCAFGTTVIFPRPDQFRYPALVSLVAVYCAAALYAKFVRDRRGHLLHMPSCLKTSRDGKEHQYQSLSVEME